MVIHKGKFVDPKQSSVNSLRAKDIEDLLRSVDAETMLSSGHKALEGPILGKDELERVLDRSPESFERSESLSAGFKVVESKVDAL